MTGRPDVAERSVVELGGPEVVELQRRWSEHDIVFNLVDVYHGGS